MTSIITDIFFICELAFTDSKRGTLQSWPMKTIDILSSIDRYQSLSS